MNTRLSNHTPPLGFQGIKTTILVLALAFLSACSGGGSSSGGGLTNNQKLAQLSNVNLKEVSFQTVGTEGGTMYFPRTDYIITAICDESRCGFENRRSGVGAEFIDINDFQVYSDRMEGTSTRRVGYATINHTFSLYGKQMGLSYSDFGLWNYHGYEAPFSATSYDATYAVSTIPNLNSLQNNTTFNGKVYGATNKGEAIAGNATVVFYVDSRDAITGNLKDFNVKTTLAFDNFYSAVFNQYAQNGSYNLTSVQISNNGNTTGTTLATGTFDTNANPTRVIKINNAFAGAAGQTPTEVVGNAHYNESNVVGGSNNNGFTAAFGAKR